MGNCTIFFTGSAKGARKCQGKKRSSSESMLVDSSAAAKLAASGAAVKCTIFTEVSDAARKAAKEVATAAIKKIYREHKELDVSKMEYFTVDKLGFASLAQNLYFFTLINFFQISEERPKHMKFLGYKCRYCKAIIKNKSDMKEHVAICKTATVLSKDQRKQLVSIYCNFYPAPHKISVSIARTIFIPYQ